MLMKCLLNPSKLSRDNNYILEFNFENERNKRFKILKLIITFLDLRFQITQEVNKFLKEPLWGIFNRNIKIYVPFKLEKNIIQNHRFLVQLQVIQLISHQWTPEFFIEFKPQNFQINPIPIFDAFNSRSIRTEECKIPDYISQLISMWGFNLNTIGIPPLIEQYTDEELLESIKLAIERTDIVFAITNIRDQLSKNLECKTFEWLQSETAIAYTLNKQIIVFIEEGVNLSGLASKLPIIRFSLNNLHLIDELFDQFMYNIRENIMQRKKTEFLFNLFKIGGVASGLGLIGRLFYTLGKQSNNNTVVN